MAGARQKQEWSHTSALLAMLANCHRDPKKTRPFKPSDFQPMPDRTRTRTPPVARADISVLKTVFVDRQQ
jgi:hypothetical protein